MTGGPNSSTETKAAETAARPELRPTRPATPARTPAFPRRARLAAWGAVATAAAVLVWMAASNPANVGRPRVAASAEVAERLQMRAPTLVGRTSDGRSYTVRAASATVADGGGDVVDLLDIRAETTLEDGVGVDASARSGRFDRLAERLTLTGDVVATRTDGYRLRTEALTIWREPGGLAAASDAATAIDGPDGRATSAGLTAAAGLDPIRLKGPVAIRLGAEATN